jgi:hypothetical protein
MKPKFWTFTRCFWLGQMLIGFVLFYKHQHYTVTWGWTEAMPAEFTSRQIVAEVWSGIAYLQILMSALAMDITFIYDMQLINRD